MEQPGIVSCTILSSAKATLINTDKKTIVKNTLNIFFISHLVDIFWPYNNSKSYQEANTIYKLQLTGKIKFAIEKQIICF